MLFAVARAVEARDEGTGDHCDRLSLLGARLGQHMGLDPEAIKRAAAEAAPKVLHVPVVCQNW